MKSGTLAEHEKENYSNNCTVGPVFTDRNCYYPAVLGKQIHESPGKEL